MFITFVFDINLEVPPSFTPPKIIKLNQVIETKMIIFIYLIRNRGTNNCTEIK